MSPAAGGAVSTEDLPLSISIHDLPFPRAPRMEGDVWGPGWHCLHGRCLVLIPIPVGAAAMEEGVPPSSHHVSGGRGGADVEQERSTQVIIYSLCLCSGKLCSFFSAH